MNLSLDFMLSNLRPVQTMQHLPRHSQHLFQCNTFPSKSCVAEPFPVNPDVSGWFAVFHLRIMLHAQFIEHSCDKPTRIHNDQNCVARVT